MARTDSDAARDAAAREAAATGNEAWAIVSRIIAGMLMYGAGGWLLGHVLAHQTLGLACGVLLGAGLGLYLSVVRIRQLPAGPEARLQVSGSNSWGAKMTRARMDRAGIDRGGAERRPVADQGKDGNGG